MKLLGIPLHRPTFGELTSATILGAGLWIAAVGLLHAGRVELGRADAGALLLVLVAGAVSARCGIRVDHGQRHLLANLVLSALLLGVYEGAWKLAGG